jgi:hypothetical protein
VNLWLQGLPLLLRLFEQLHSVAAEKRPGQHIAAEYPTPQSQWLSHGPPFLARMHSASDAVQQLWRAWYQLQLSWCSLRETDVSNLTVSHDPGSINDMLNQCVRHCKARGW